MAFFKDDAETGKRGVRYLGIVNILTRSSSIELGDCVDELLNSDQCGLIALRSCRFWLILIFESFVERVLIGLWEGDILNLPFSRIGFFQIDEYLTLVSKVERPSVRITCYTGKRIGGVKIES